MVLVEIEFEFWNFLLGFLLGIGAALWLDVICQAIRRLRKRK